jgi:hypothetical protein
MKNWIFLLLALPLLTFSCRKDLDTITTSTTTYQAPEILVTASLTGQVIDENGEAVSNAIVRLGNKATVTNEVGLYQFKNETMNARGTYVTVIVDGYFHASDRFYPVGGSHHTNTIQLIRKTNVGTVSGAEGGIVAFEEAGITFEANSIANSQGQLVSGTVNVAAKWLNPTAENLGDFMPGDLYGFDKDGREVVMTTMGMLAVELTDEAGNEVNIANGRTATVRFPVPAELQSKAPATIPMWHFDETDGIWIEEGSATLEDGIYVGEVSHFSYWNVDIPCGTEVVYISGCMIYIDGTGAAHQQFHLSYGADLLHLGYGSTGNQGEFNGPVPANEIIVFEIYDDCGEEINVIEVGPFSEDTELEECFLAASNNDVTIFGELLDCNGQPVDGGIIQFDWGTWNGGMVVTGENGTFSTVLTNCSSALEITLVGYDISNLESTGELTYTLTETTDIGAITACENPLENYIDSDMNGREIYFFNPYLLVDSIPFNPDSLSESLYSSISATNISPTGDYDNIQIWVSDIAVGSYTGIDAAFIYQMDTNSPINLFPNPCYPPCETVTINITSNGGPGGFLVGDYSGTISGFDQMQMPINDVPVSGTFRVSIPE